MTSLFTEAPAAVATPQVRSPSPLRSLLAGLVLAVAQKISIGKVCPCMAGMPAEEGIVGLANRI